MLCPKCGDKTTVFDSSFNHKINEYYRKRRCLACGHEFFTAEFEVEPTEQFLKDWLEYHRRTRNDRKRKEDRRKQCKGCANYDYMGGPHCKDCEVIINRRKTIGKLCNKE